MLGISRVVYLDDGTTITPKSSKGAVAAQQNQFIVNLIWATLGFHLNWEKTVLTPSHRYETLGYIFDSNHMMIGISSEIILKYAHRIFLASTGGDLVIVRDICQIYGLFAANRLAIKNIRVHASVTDMFYRSLLSGNSEPDYDQEVKVPETVLDEWNIWETSLNLWNWKPVCDPDPDLILHIDASGSKGWGFRVKTGSLVTGSLVSFSIEITQ
jgi:hypothetical protein